MLHLVFSTDSMNGTIMADIIGSVQVNETVTVTVTKKYTVQLPCFDMLCTTRRRGKVNSKDMYTILENLSAPATKLFWTFIRTRNEDSNQVRYLPTNKSERLKLDKAYKELRTLEVIKRVKQGIYLINPSAYLCTASKFEDVKAHWESLP